MPQFDSAILGIYRPNSAHAGKAQYRRHMAQIMWFRRDLRIGDNPALAEAIKRTEQDGQAQLAAVYVLGPRTWAAMSSVQKHYLMASLAKLDESLGGHLIFKYGDAKAVIPKLAKDLSASAVHIAVAHTPHAIARDAAVAQLLAEQDIEFVPTGSAYAVAPGRVTKADGTYYKVYTPFYKNWLVHGWRGPAPAPTHWPVWVDQIISDPLPELPPLEGLDLPVAGEAAALERWEYFKKSGLADYNELRNRPDLDGTSILSTALRFGEVHPRTLLADLGDDPGHVTYRKEIAWREFYADILFQRPDTLAGYYNKAYEAMAYDSGTIAQQRFIAWTQGQTGYPLVDAGMRQLRTTGWMHNRVRMVVASFLVKDLHLEWTLGAQHFEQWLTDFDPASNSHGWQWTAGCGTDASPYYRVFNPVGQGIKFDPNGDYIRKYIPELRHISGAAAHEPWLVEDGHAHGYPKPIIDHAAERIVALDRLAKLPKGQVQIGAPDKDVDQAQLIQSFE